MTNSSKMFLISEDMAMTIIDYMSQRPWFEVQQLIPAIQRLQPAPEPEEIGSLTKQERKPTKAQE